MTCTAEETDTVAVLFVASDTDTRLHLNEAALHLFRQRHFFPSSLAESRKTLKDVNLALKDLQVCTVDGMEHTLVLLKLLRCTINNIFYSVLERLTCKTAQAFGFLTVQKVNQSNWSCAFTVKVE